MNPRPLLPLLLTLFALPAAAQMSQPLTFAAGEHVTIAEATITGHEYFDHMITGKAGQTLNVTLEPGETNGHGSAFFNILPPGSDGYAIYIGSMNGNEAQITLPEDGTYAIRVYLMGNDKDAGKSVAYSIQVSLF